DDYDAVPVCGFDWIHWLVCDLKRASVAEGESGKSGDFTEGCNSWHGIADELTAAQATGYGGPAPPRQGAQVHPEGVRPGLRAGTAPRIHDERPVLCHAGACAGTRDLGGEVLAQEAIPIIFPRSPDVGPGSVFPFAAMSIGRILANPSDAEGQLDFTHVLLIYSLKTLASFGQFYTIAVIAVIAVLRRR
ncbi:MAG: hypothetical protein II855_07980, partial [Candidatus Methanomethylophilaceae archaeon]|nr:hypothetical protein [Candidatus Methanomethylophilaceae archaeon]